MKMNKMKREIDVKLFVKGNSFPQTRFGGIFLQHTTWQVNKSSTYIFSYMTFLMSHVTFSNNTCGWSV